MLKTNNMLGIVIKDYYETFCLKKNIIGMIFSLSVILLVVALIDNLYAFILTSNYQNCLILIIYCLPYLLGIKKVHRSVL